MGKKKKMQQFAEVSAFENCFEHDTTMRGKWNEIYFKNNQPITIELACGKGEYTLALAQRFPERNFIGIDIKGNRIWKGAKYALENKLTNVAFLRIMISNITEYFAPEEISEIWITFPDPQHQKLRKRLTNLLFLERYRQISTKTATLNLKTDSTRFYTFTKEIIQEQNLDLLEDFENVYESENAPEYLTNVQTFYENIWLKLGKTIRYLKYQIHR